MNPRNASETSITVPPGSPTWITPESIADTIRVWQPYYRERLTAEDAVEILVNFTRLAKLLAEPNK